MLTYKHDQEKYNTVKEDNWTDSHYIFNKNKEHRKQKAFENKLQFAEMCPAVASGIVTGDALVSYWGA